MTRTARTENNCQVKEICCSSAFSSSVTPEVNKNGHGFFDLHDNKCECIAIGVYQHFKKTRQTEEEVGRQHQGMDRSGVRQVLEGSGEQRKMEEASCEIICDAPTILTG